MNRRGFIAGGAAFGLAPFVGCRPQASVERPVRFLFMTDHHVESDFVQSHGKTKGQPVYTMWKPGNHAALVKTYEFINSDSFCGSCDFALFGGDQLNTGYTRYPDDLTAELAQYHRTLEHLDLHARTRGQTADLDFVAAPWVVRENLGKAFKPYAVTPKPLASRVIAIQGNHDTGVDEFYRDAAFTAGNVRFITFFATYVGLPPPPGKLFHSTAKISDETLAFVTREMRKARANPAIRHIVLASHWAIAPTSADFTNSIIGPCPENEMNDNRARLLAVARECGCRLFINGHEHNGRYPTATFDGLTDINCGTVTQEGGGGAFAVVEMTSEAATFHVYTRATAEERAGKVVFTELPRKLFTRRIPL